MNDLCTHEVVGSKNVYTVNDHHHALLAWASIRRTVDRPLSLISLDHHTDTRPAFLRNVYFALNRSPERSNSSEGDNLRRRLAASIDFHDLRSVRSAVDKLAHDEHIHAAILSQIMDIAFIIQLTDSNGTESIEWKEFRKEKYGGLPPWADMVREPEPPFTYEVPEDRMFIVPTICMPNCSKPIHDDDCTRFLCDNVLDDAFLTQKREVVEEMASFYGMSGLSAKPYILDIDLDFFHTRQAVDPDNAGEFLNLVRGAAAITIAQEPSCVNDLQLDGEELSVEYLLSHIKEHIRNA